MATIVVRDVPDELHERLKRLAAASHRSLNGQVLVALEQAARYQQVIEDLSPAERAELLQWLRGDGGHE